MASSPIILTHRGYWTDASEHNTAAAFRRSFQSGFGTETDVRDIDGRLVISHDPPRRDAMDFEEFLEIYHETCKGGLALPLALNIKADGLTDALLGMLERHKVQNYFVFDMSVPDTRRWVAAEAKVFVRQSDVEREPVFYEGVAGLWLDTFEKDWIDEGVLLRHLGAEKSLCLVSPELHGRDEAGFWSWLRDFYRAHAPGKIMLCTDKPAEAEGYFLKSSKAVAKSA